MPGIINAHGDCSYLVRVGPDCQSYGDPWTWCVSVEDEGDGCCVLYGVESMPTPEEQGWLRDTLAEKGFTRARWSRMKEGKERKTRYFEVR